MGFQKRNKVNSHEIGDYGPLHFSHLEERIKPLEISTASS